MKPLEGIKVVNLSINIPGPTTAMRLQELGASVVKIEPPSGDPTALISREYYTRVTEGQEILALDLKDFDGRARLTSYLDEADLLLTAHRTAALKRLNLDWATLHEDFPQLCQVAIVGRCAPHDNEPGHDLNYQALCGLLNPPEMPRVLVADLGAAEHAATMAVALILAREREGGEAGYVQVAIEDAGHFFAIPLNHGFIVGGPLGGDWPAYGLYQTADGYIAVAALEFRLLDRLKRALQIEDASRPELKRIFATRSAQEWEEWAREHGVPIVAVRDPEFISGTNSPFLTPPS